MAYIPSTLRAQRQMHRDSVVVISNESARLRREIVSLRGLVTLQFSLLVGLGLLWFVLLQ